MTGILTQGRRGFLKLTATVVGALTLARYAEPILAMADQHHDWIEDRGDYLIVRVPDFKTFAREAFNKPVIFLLGQEAIVDQVEVTGYANFFAPRSGRLTNSFFDGRQMTTENPRALLLIKGVDLCMEACNFQGAATSAIEVQHAALKPPIFNGYRA